MRVLIVVPRLDLPGGVANYYRVLRPYFDTSKTYFEVGRREHGGGIGVIRLVRDYRDFRRRLKTGEYDLVHLNPSLGRKAIVRDGLLLLIAKRQRLRVLVFIRGWNHSLADLIARRFRWLFRFVYGRADAFIVLAREFRERLAEWGIDAPIYLDTTVVDDAAFSAIQEPGNDDEPGAPVNLLFMSRLDEGKGLRRAVEAFELLRRRHPACSLSIAGEGSEELPVRELIRQRHIDNVRFLGHVEGAAKREALLSADIFFFPTSYGEGMPNAVVEAMAYGLPVVTRPVGGIRDFFEDGRMGYITDSNDPAEFARILEPLTLDASDRRRIGAYNRDYARDNFAASRVVARLESIYREI